MIVFENDFKIAVMSVPFSKLTSALILYLFCAYTGSFNIQSCAISTANTTLLVKCTFFMNSTATGFVVVDNEQSQKAFNRTLLNDSDKGSVNFTGLPAGEYSVRVYDDKLDFVNGKSPAYEHFQSIHILAFTSPSLETVLSTAAHSLHNSSEQQVMNSRVALKIVFLLYMSAVLYTIADATLVSLPSVYSTSPVHSPVESINSNTIILATSITTGLLILLVILIVIILILLLSVAMTKRKKMTSKNSFCYAQIICILYSGTDIIDNVPVDDNPAYITMKRITLNKNTAYETVNITSHNYETVKF